MKKPAKKIGKAAKSAADRPGQTRLERELVAALRARMAADRLTVNGLAAAAGLDNGQLYRLLGGQRSLTLPAAGRLADYLGLSLSLSPRR